MTNKRSVFFLQKTNKKNIIIASRTSSLADRQAYRHTYRQTDLGKPKNSCMQLKVILIVRMTKMMIIEIIR